MILVAFYLWLGLLLKEPHFTLNSWIVFNTICLGIIKAWHVDSWLPPGLFPVDCSLHLSLFLSCVGHVPLSGYRSRRVTLSKTILTLFLPSKHLLLDFPIEAWLSSLAIFLDSSFSYLNLISVGLSIFSILKFPFNKGNFNI